jgi:hypothetical protein
MLRSIAATMPGRRFSARRREAKRERLGHDDGCAAAAGRIDSLSPSKSAR